jgi:hypothetical protein
MVLKKLRVDHSGQSKLHILEFIIHTEGYVNGWETLIDALAGLTNRFVPTHKLHFPARTFDLVMVNALTWLAIVPEASKALGPCFEPQATL